MRLHAAHAFAIAGLLAASFLTVPLARADAPATGAASPPPAPGMPNFVMVVFDGLAADSVRGPFMAGFRGAFGDPTFATERPGVRVGQWLPGIPLSNRFRLLEGTPAEGTWQAQVAMEWLKPGTAASNLGVDGGKGSGRNAPSSPTPTKRRSVTRPLRPDPAVPMLPGARMTYWALTPEAVAAGARVIPERETLRFRFATSAGPKFWSQAGRRAALVLIEALHHQSEDLDADIRIQQDDCDRGGP